MKGKRLLFTSRLLLKTGTVFEASESFKQKVKSNYNNRILILLTLVSLKDFEYSCNIYLHLTLKHYSR